MINIIGDITTATKFYIINSRGSIEFVHNLEVAKRYVSMPCYKEWYGRTIYATNENFVKDKKGIVRLESQVSEKEVETKTVKQALIDFKDQADAYVNTKLQDFSKLYGYDTIWTMISWQNSSVKKYKEEAKLAIAYRDKVYTYHFDFVNKLENDVLTDVITSSDFSEYYSNYIQNFPEIVKRED